MTIHPILRSTDNPHELLDVRCATCKQRLIESREEVHQRGWHVFVEFNWSKGGRVEEYFCPDCFDDPEFD